MRRKFLFLVADGMGGWPGELNEKTALEAAATPAMDAMAREGLVGLSRTIPPGMAPGSDVANMALLGFDPEKHHTGRGPIEAAAQGLQLAPDDLVWRLNLVSVSEYSEQGRMLDYSAGHITSEESRPLVQALSAAVPPDNPFRLYPGVQYRHLLVHKGGAGEPEAGLAINPPHDITGRTIAKDIAAYKTSARLWELTSRAARHLADASNTTKANAVWPWGQGRTLTLASFEDATGLKGAVVSAVDLVKGLGRAANMEVLDVPGATGLLDTNYEGKVQAASQFLQEGDFVFVHLEGPDECGHGGDAPGKALAISRFDARIVTPLRRAFPDALFCITCDHLTPIAKRTHVDDPVPFLLYGQGISSNGAARFSEAAAQAAGLMVEPGHLLLNWAITKAGGLA